MLEIQGPDTALLDEPLRLRLRGAGPDAQVVWLARMRDDDGLVWRARADRPEDLPGAWRGKAERAALGSLRPVRIDVRAETAGGEAAARTVTRLIAAKGVRIRRWRDAVRGVLCLPAGAPGLTLVVDARGDDAAATLAAPLLASRGALVLAVTAGDLDAAREQLAAVPGAGPAEQLDGAAMPWPPGTPGGDRAAWEALLARIG
jgi:hypothetical protein